ncbi:NAD(P)-dependent oxidoreductase [Amnibacterium endophyticum]|uniref:NAD(P)-dependent oxidoreductase n=1 Tax=Amnibacterium endophyticum TaxID=2109337 RepID=A0ABW4LFY0_9MICO
MVVSDPVVAVLGLGAMGLPMAARLAERFAVTAFDLTAGRRAAAREAGATDRRTAIEAVAGADVVVIAVRSAGQLDAVLFGSEGVAAHLEEGCTVILTSTVGIQAARGASARLAEAGTGLRLVDAPLSGGPVRARAGDLLIVVGAEDAAYAHVEPVLRMLGSTISRVGALPGDGQALKTVNQLLCGVHIAAAAEALALADALGLDQAAALEALGEGAAASFMLANRGPRMLDAYGDDGAEVLSRLDIFVKDLGIVGDAARSAGMAAPVAAAAEQLFLLGAAQGLATEDDSAVIRVVAPTRRT